MVDPATGAVTTDANRDSPRQSELPKLPDGWCWKRFDAVCERVSVGHVGPTTEFFCENGSGIPLIRSQDSAEKVFLQEFGKNFSLTDAV